MGEEKPKNSNGEQRRPPHRFKPGVSGNPKGRKPDTPEQKMAKKALKVIIAEYRERLAEALPDLAPVLVGKAQQGDIPAIRELHDRVMGRPEQRTDITTGGKPIPILSHVVPGNERDPQDSGADEAH